MEVISRVQEKNMGYKYENLRQKIRKKKLNGSIYLPGSQFRESEGRLNLSFCLQDTIIKSSPRIGKYINKH